MTQKLAAAAIIVAVAAFASQAQAAFISGTVDFVGVANTDGTGPLDATAFTSFSGVNVDIGTGSYSGTVGASAAIQPFSFNPVSGPIANLWSFTSGGVTYSFDVSTLVKDFQGFPSDAPGLGVIRVSGTGTAHATGYSDTPGSFVLHASGGLADLELAFGATSAAFPPGVPEGGNTMLLMGAAVGGLALLRKRVEQTTAAP